MTGVSALATYLPVWGDARGRVPGPDEDAVTMAVAAGLGALSAADVASGSTGSTGASIEQVTVVTRDLPYLEGNSSAPLLAGLGLADSVRACLVLGGGPQALDAVTHARAGTLVIGVDVTGQAGAAAAVVGQAGLELRALARNDRSLPVRLRDARGSSHDYGDPRLTRERGLHAGLARLDLRTEPVAVTGVAGNAGSAGSAGPGAGRIPPLPTTGASAPLFALAALVEQDVRGPLVAFEEATLVAVDVTTGTAAVHRDQAPALPPPPLREATDAAIAISLPAYERAFEPKLRLEAGACRQCGALALPPRRRCLTCGDEQPSTLVSLPRRAEVYTTVTVRVPVPGIPTPYSLVIVELGPTGVRVIAQTTSAVPASVAIGDHGTMLLRRVAVRHGVPDYGYAFSPDRDDPQHGGASLVGAIRSSEVQG